LHPDIFAASTADREPRALRSAPVPVPGLRTGGRRRV